MKQTKSGAIVYEVGDQISFIDLVNGGYAKGIILGKSQFVEKSLEMGRGEKSHCFNVKVGGEEAARQVPYNTLDTDHYVPRYGFVEVM